MSRRSLRPFLPLTCALALLMSGSARSAAAAPEDRVAVTARVALEAPQAEGEVRIAWTNPDEAPARELRLRLFANRFRTLDVVDGLARHELLAGPTFSPGGTDLVSVESDGTPLSWRADPSDPTIAIVALAHEAPPGGRTTITVAFRTRLPNLLDTFGAGDGLAVADGGWFPTPAGARELRADEARIEGPAGRRLLVDGEIADGGKVDLHGPPRRLSIVISDRPFVSETVRTGPRRIEVIDVPANQHAHRISPNESPADALKSTLEETVDASPPGGDFRLVRLPLRWSPSSSSEHVVLASDRLFEIFPMLRPLHQRELAYAVFLHDELQANPVPLDPDAQWVAEGLAWRRAQALYEQKFRSGREVKDWIRLFNVFAIVDRFETAPRIPLVRPFFPTTISDDPLRIEPAACCFERPPGRFLFDKLEARLGHAVFASLLDRYRHGEGPLRALLAKLGRADAVELVAAWDRKPVAVNYALANVERNPDGRPGARFSILRRSLEERPDSIAIGLEGEDGSELAFVDLVPGETRVEKQTPFSIAAVELDPLRTTVQTQLGDDRSPPRYQLVLDSSDVEVSSSEFGISTLLVGRQKYDYRKDVAAAIFYTSRGYGADAGFQLHFGEPIDANLYRQNLFVYYAGEQLDSSFAEDRGARARTHGQLGGFGFRFNSYDRTWIGNPSGSHHLRVFFDAYDPSLGSDFGFVQGGASLSYGVPVRDDTVVAMQVLNGFSKATGDGPIPNQGLFSLGGFRSIRGIAAEDELGKDIFMVRAELRHMLPFRLDWNLQEIVIAHRVQLKAFVDAGRVSDSTRGLYRVKDFAVGVGGGFNLFYDFMGFFPTTFYLDVATRADESGSPQVLFGVGQPF